ncbi:uncharacterized protein AMSG_01281 [Thecamonas trahens ATCC 50062]|uniref:Tyrosine-protein kinase ephrin type A/B receptor-like domain-containing protein n=1 Tax=Thecamonas trahens ATCC 50062 TaxID=461836 RepID=A0A0L0DNK4_THETB|nr:hypothetical protein AMSG_01281 [Thecamonas trahens ATCC 50062]KNC53571.1 hypothetical protein AMSG_01281 [Thecamonas trahens ATCC 50062]|eukprot:XP_013761888.1 hypothetical protein AMSG_01281 [Thecamonas trahens ATCC 50062]
MALVVTVAASAAHEQRLYLGTASGGALKPGWRDATTTGALIGLSRGPGGPYDASGGATLLVGRNYTLVNESPHTVYLTTTPGVVFGHTSGGGMPSGDGNSVAASAFGSGSDVIPSGGSAVLMTRELTAPNVLFFQSTTAANLGWLLSLVSCTAPAPPETPQLISPAAGAAVDVGVRLSWEPVSEWGVNCAALAAEAGGTGSTEASGWKYRVLVREGSSLAPLNASFDAPGQVGSGLTASHEPFLVLTQASIQPGTTYAWAVQATNGAVSAMSNVRTFTVRGSVTPSPTPAPAPSNGVLGIHRILPTVPASAVGYAYFTVELETPGGELVITGSSASLPIPGAPAAGSIKLYANSGNGTGDEVMRFPRAGEATYVSSEDDASARQTIVVASATSSRYYVGVGAASGAATFSLAATYACPHGMYLSDPTSTRCEACPVGAVTSSAGATSREACVCGPGYYGDAATGLCSACPEGGVCMGGRAPGAMAGFFAASSDRGAVAYKCPQPVACLGGAAPSQCRTGYAGELCSSCAKGSHYELNSRCFECPAAPELNMLVGVALLVLFLLASGELARFYRHFACVPVAINFVQTVAILPLFQLEWPQHLVLFFNDCSGFNLNPELTAANCYVEMKWRTFWLFKLLLPVVVAALFGAVYAAVRSGATLGLKCCADGWSYLGLGRALKRRLVPAYMTFLMFVYVSVAGAALSFFDCTKQPDGSYTLDASADIVCYGSSWYELLPAAVLGVFVYAVGIPVVLLVVLIERSRHLYAVTPHGDAIYAYLGPLYLRYRPEVYWWEAIHFARKAALLAWAYFLTTFTLVQAAGALATVVGFLVAHLVVGPYEYGLANQLDALLQGIIGVLLLAGLLFQSGSLPETASMDEIVFAIVATLFVVALVVSVAAALRELYVLETPVSHEQLEGIRERLGAAETLHFDNVEALAAGKAAPTGGYNTPGTTAYEYEYASSS